MGPAGALGELGRDADSRNTPSMVQGKVQGCSWGLHQRSIHRIIYTSLPVGPQKKARSLCYLQSHPTASLLPSSKGTGRLSKASLCYGIHWGLDPFSPTPKGCVRFLVSSAVRSLEAGHLGSPCNPGTLEGQGRRVAISSLAWPTL